MQQYYFKFIFKYFFPFSIILGISVICDLPHDRCTVNVTGWYYGKTGGLFGTYDNEPSNDWTKSDNTLADSPETLAASWSVAQRCRTRNNAVQVSGRRIQYRLVMCIALQ